ncbi:MAG: hypothetical protein ABR574_02885 [Cryomorphaceae bacterium]|nr:hypothetical protein [Flavobacteriales bacterium]
MTQILTIKKIISTLIISSATILSCSLQPDVENEAQFVRNFYTNYMSIVLSDLSLREMNEELEQLVSRSCTEDLINRLPSKMKKSGADVFLKSQDCNKYALESLKIEQLDGTVDNIFLVQYTDSFADETVEIHISLEKMKGQLLINNVW